MTLRVIYGLLGGAGFATFVAAVVMVAVRGFGGPSRVSTERPVPMTNPAGSGVDVEEESPARVTI
jgi:hypothetical protein